MKKLKLFLKKIPCINLFCILALIPILRYVFPFTFDNDFWFTINQGRYILENSFPIKAIGTIHNLDFMAYILFLLSIMLCCF